MATIKLDFLIIETHSPYTLAVADFSTYPANYVPVSPTLQVTATGFPLVTLTFTPNTINVYTSENLGITCAGQDIVPLPDGLYVIKYTINPAFEHYVEKTIMLTSQIQEKFDGAFMQLDMMECDGPIRKQRKQELDSIYYFIQGSIAAANKCANALALKMYSQADKMLTNFITNKCNCNG